MIIQNTTNSLKLNLKEKELLYDLFYEIISAIKNTKIEFDNEIYNNKLKKIPTKQLIEYIHDSINILLNQRFDEGREKQKIDDMKKFKNKKPINNNYIYQFENLLKKSEEKERHLIYLNFKNKIEINEMKNKIIQLLDIKKEYETMKSKLKYENGKFLENDRKDNEILILRYENINLKKHILNKEMNLKKLENELFEKNKMIVLLENKIEKLNQNTQEKSNKGVLTMNYYKIENNTNSNSTTNILSGNKQDTDNKSMNLNTKHHFKNKYKIYKRNQSSHDKLLRNDSFEHTKHFFMNKYLSNNQKKNQSLSNSCNNIKTNKLPLKNLKVNFIPKDISLLGKYPEISSYHSPNNLLENSESKKRLFNKIIEKEKS